MPLSICSHLQAFPALKFPQSRVKSQPSNTRKPANTERRFGILFSLNQLNWLTDQPLSKEGRRKTRLSFGYSPVLTTLIEQMSTALFLVWPKDHPLKTSHSPKGLLSKHEVSRASIPATASRRATAAPRTMPAFLPVREDTEDEPRNRGRRC